MSRKDFVTVYKDRAGEWRWRRVAPNGRIIADSGEGYKNRGHAVAMAKRINKRASFEIQP